VPPAATADGDARAASVEPAAKPRRRFLFFGRAR
jgi:hypothetical protein